jgi:hypothetical protein
LRPSDPQARFVRIGFPSDLKIFRVGQALASTSLRTEAAKRAEAGIERQGGLDVGKGLCIAVQVQQRTSRAL